MPETDTVNMPTFCSMRININIDALRDHLYNLKKLKNTHGGVLLLEKLQAFSLQFYQK